MPCPTLFAVLFLAASTLPGIDVDHPADDRAIFAQLEAATAKLAEQTSGRLTRTERLDQAKRTKTEAVRLTPPSRAPLSGEESYRRAAAASVVIGSAYKCDKCSKWHHTLASGFAITADGVIATNHHVVAGATGEAMGVMTADGRFFPVVEVLAADKAHDVALLRVEAQDLPFLPLRDDAPAGSPIRCYSHPASTFGCFSDGIITRYYKMREPDRAGATFMQITADYARGSSGGPILDACGNAVGMVASTSPVFAATPSQHPAAKDAKPATPSQQMVRHNCATARAILELTRPR
jgi:S1-C subfamily serine protease